MSFRGQVLRTNSQTQAYAQPVGQDGGCLIFCDTFSGGGFGDSGESHRGAISLSVTENYRRVFVSATVWGITNPWGGTGITANIRDLNSDVRVASHAAAVGDDGSLCLTGAIDLPVGTYVFAVELDGDTTYAGGALQLIVGQTVSESHCLGESSGGMG